MIRLPILRTPVNISVPVKKPFEYNEKIVYLDGNTEIDITSDVLIWNIERRSLKYGIGSFVIILNNNNGQYLNKINEDTIIRIYANKELKNLEKLLLSLPKILQSGGRAVFISFHSLEDKLVKNYFRKYAKEKIAKILTKKPVTVGSDELGQNIRSRSAKLRAIMFF